MADAGMGLGLYSWFAFLETLGRVWDTRFYVWLLTFAGAACLFACNAPALDVFLEGRKCKLSRYMITKPAWIARYDEGMITGLGLYNGVGGSIA
jgi:hypothetical protein